MASSTFASTSVPSSSRARRGRDEDGGDKTRRVVRVPKSQFVDVTEKISKQTTAEAFRQRFETRKAKPRPGLEVEEEEEDDLDSFFEELDRARDEGESHILSFFFSFLCFERFEGGYWLEWGMGVVEDFSKNRRWGLIGGGYKLESLGSLIRSSLYQEAGMNEGRKGGSVADLCYPSAHCSKTVTATSGNTGTFTATPSSTPRITPGGGVPVPGRLSVGSREISSGLGRSSGLPNKDDKDDEWLDAMLGGR